MKTHLFPSGAAALLLLAAAVQQLLLQQPAAVAAAAAAAAQPTDPHEGAPSQGAPGGPSAASLSAGDGKTGAL